MLDDIFKGLFDTDMTQVIPVTDFLACLGCSLVIGVILAIAYMYRSRYTKSFAAALAMLPAVVCVVIMMVNGNVGAGVAVAGAFSLVRFRSAPGTAKEIGAIFIGMGAGLITGMGYIAFGILFAVIMSLVTVLYSRLDLRITKNNQLHKTLRITIPEDLDYTGVFDVLFSEYAREWELAAVKTTDMGSLYKLTYNITLKKPELEKEFIDKLRCRNGNLEISLSKQDTSVAVL